MLHSRKLSESANREYSWNTRPSLVISKKKNTCYGKSLATHYKKLLKFVTEISKEIYGLAPEL